MSSEVKTTKVTNVNPSINLKYVNNFLTYDECNKLMELANEKLNKSVVTDGITDTFSSQRTSTSYYIPKNTEDIKSIEDKIVNFLAKHIDNNKNWIAHLEHLQVVKYDIGQKFDQHYDWFREEYVEKYGNQRQYTFFVYLNTLPRGSGGETEFLKLNKRFFPKKGNALFWKNCDDASVGDIMTLHKGNPIKKGSKFGLNVWIRLNPTSKF